MCRLCEEKLATGSIQRNDQFEGVISIYKYDGVIKKIIEMIKYDFVSDATKEMAELICRHLQVDYPNVVKYWQEETFGILAIPLHDKRQRWRGFNQSELLAREVAKGLKLNYETELLVRKNQRTAQAKIKNYQERRENILEAFEVKKEGKVRNKLIIVDDVITSGATMTTALKTLKESGLTQAWALSLAGVQR